MRTLPLVLSLTVLAATSGAQQFFNPARVDARTFPLMAWGGSPSDPAMLQGMKDAGLNVSGFCRVDDLDKVKAAGLKCFVQDRRLSGYKWTAMPPDAEWRAKVTEVAGLVRDHDAALGFYLIDEPHASLMPAMGQVSKLMRELAPGKWPYVNLFPYMVNADRMGVPDYDTYVKMLVNTIGQPFLSYDNYSLVNGEMREAFYNNLETVRRVGLETKTPFWNCILANSHFNYMEPSDATFHLQVYATLAYGGRGIQYFTYYTPNRGNYRLGAVDQFGNRTATWDALRRINLEVHALAPTIVKLRSTGVYHYPDVPKTGKALTESKLVEAVKPAKGRFLIGEFEDDRGRPYVMIVNKDLAASYRFELLLKNKDAQLMRVNNYSGVEEAFGREMDWLAPGAGILFRVAAR